MRYKNTKTGIEFESKSKVSGANIIALDVPTTTEEPIKAPPSPPQTEAPKSAPKKSVKKVKK